MSASDSEESYSKHQYKKHKRRRSNSESFWDCKKRHKSHKRKSNDRHYDQKRRKLKEESKDYVKVKSEPKDKDEDKLWRAEAAEKDGSKRESRLHSYERSTRHEDIVRHRITKVRDHPQVRGSAESHSDETSEESYKTGMQDRRLPEDLKTEVRQLLVLGVDKDRLYEYICNVTKKPFDRKILVRISEASVKYQKEISKGRALLLIQKVYNVETEQEAEQIFQLLLKNRSARKSRKQEPEEFSENETIAITNEGKMAPKAEHRNRDGRGGPHGEAEGTKRRKSTKAVDGVEKPNFSLSGKLAEDTNVFNGVVVKYSEPPEARMPKKRWRLYPFKGDQGLPTLYIHRQSAYLLGRDRKVADIPIDHPSCSKQHAALQYRLVTYQRGDGTTGKQIRLYIIDLESANGTYINNNKIEPRKYVELFEKDVIKFGFSSREYVLLHEHSKDNDSESES